MDNTFTCAMCNQTFEKGWTEEEALAEAKEYWGDTTGISMTQVCDDCWEKIRPETHPIEWAEANIEIIEQWRGVVRERNIGQN